MSILLIDKKDVIIDEKFKIEDECITLNDHDKHVGRILLIRNDYDDIMKRLDNIHYEDDKYCSRYLGDYIEKYVMKFLGGEPIPKELEDRRDGILRRPIDFLLDYKGNKLKIKHVSGCLVYSERNGLYWQFDIGHNHRPDAFILTAWDTRKSLIPMHMWMIMKDDQNFGKKSFWKKYDLIVENTKNRMSFMEQFEMNVRLGVLQNFVTQAKKKDFISVLIDTRRKIMLKTGIDMGLKQLASIAILRGLKKM